MIALQKTLMWHCWIRVQGILCVISLVWLCLVPPPLAAAERVALVLGNSAYSPEIALRNPANDARAVSELLLEMGFDNVDLVLDADRFEMESALDRFSAAIDGAETAFFYYAGHGLQINGENLLVPVDLNLTGRRDINKLTRVAEIVEEVERASNFGVVVLDACRNNPFANQLNQELGRSLVRNQGLSLQNVRGNTLLAFATEANGVAADGTGSHHSPYTKALIQYLALPNTDIRQMFGKVRDRVMLETDAKQRPFVYGSLGGANYFLVDDPSLAGNTGSGAVQGVAMSVEAEKLVWNSAVQGNSASDYAAYLESYPAGLFVTLARTRIETIQSYKDVPEGMGRFQVVADPADAKIRIMNIKEKYRAGMLLTLGNHYDVIVTRKGYRGDKQRFVMRSRDQQLYVSLVAHGSTNSPRDVVVSESGSAVLNGLHGDEGTRLQAIENALQMAVLRVSSGLLSRALSEGRGRDSYPVDFSRQILDDRLKEDTIFLNVVLARAAGFAQVIKTGREWRDGELYNANVDVVIRTDKLKDKLTEAGLIGMPVSSPDTFIALNQRVNGKALANGGYTMGYLRDVLDKNGIHSLSLSEANADLLVPVEISYSVNHIVQYNTYSANCTGSFEVVDKQTGVSLGGSQKSAGPVPGFTSAEVRSECARKILPALAKDVSVKLSLAVNNTQAKGRSYSLEITKVPQMMIYELGNTIRQIYQVEGVSELRFSGDKLSLQVVFKGPSMGFVDAVVKTLDYRGMAAEIMGVGDNSARLMMHPS